MAFLCKHSEKILCSKINLYSLCAHTTLYIYIAVAAMTSFPVNMGPFYIFSPEKPVYSIVSLQFQ